MSWRGVALFLLTCNLRSLLFAGLLINRDKLPWWLQWLETTSFFHAAFEALLVNEVRYLQLKDHR